MSCKALEALKPLLSLRQSWQNRWTIPIWP